MLAAASVTDLVAVVGAPQAQLVSTVVLLDEFAARAAAQAARLFARARSAGISLILAAPELADLTAASPQLQGEVIANLSELIAHRQSIPASAETVAEVAASRPAWITTQQTDRGAYALKRGSRRRGHELHIHPSTLKQLRAGVRRRRKSFGARPAAQRMRGCCGLRDGQRVEVADRPDDRGRGVGLEMARAYNSQAAAEGAKGAFGYGWSSSFSDRLVVEPASKRATLYQADGATVPFAEGGEGSYSAPAWSPDKLAGSAEHGYTLTYADQTRYKFAGAGGRLESVVDRNGNETTMTYNRAGQPESVTDPAGRKLALTYNSERLVEVAKDPMGHEVRSSYEAGSLASVTEPGATSPRWRFKYDSSHEITSELDGAAAKRPAKVKSISRRRAAVSQFRRGWADEQRVERRSVGA